LTTTTDHRKVLTLALPAAANALLDMLGVIVDLLMVGRISTYAIAAVGLGLQSLMMFFAFTALFHIGTTAVISRYIGAKSFKKASYALSSVIRFGLWSALPFTTLWLLISTQLYTLFGTDAMVNELGFEYVGVLTAMIPFVILKLVFVSALNAYGDTRTPLVVKIVSIILNVALNYLLIFGYGSIPAMGVAGAALATVIVNILECAIYALLYIRRRTPFTPMWGYSIPLVRKLLRVGIPSSVDRILSVGSYMLFSFILASYGTHAFAGYQLGLRIEGLAYMPGIGFTIAAMTLVGQGLGARNPAQAKADVILTMRYTILFMGVLGFFMVGVPEVIAGLFTDDAATIAYASIYLIIVGLSQIPLALNFVLGGALRGAGDSATALKVNLVTLWTIRLFPAWLISLYWHDIVLVYFAMIADTIIKAIILWRVFDKGEWQKIRL